MRARIVEKHGINAELFPAPQNICETQKIFLNKQIMF